MSDIVAALRERSGQIDQRLSAWWQSCDMDASMALVAVGGYGRAELFPYSDVDVLVLLPDGLDVEAPVLRAKIETFIGGCWDQGLHIGSSVRSFSDCLAESQKDITVQTALLESRCITGDEALFNRFFQTLMQQMQADAFSKAKLLEMRQRHQKYDDTPYALEPNCKESPGGLRDLQMILWLAKAAGFGHSWQELMQHGLINPLEAESLEKAEHWLWRVRQVLHQEAKRREDRLVFDLQPAVAKCLGYHGDNPHALAENLMKDYYWQAKSVTQLSQIVLLNMDERLNPSTHHANPIADYAGLFFEKAGMLDVADVDVFVKHPLLILETFFLYTEIPGIKGLSAQTLRALFNAREVMDDAWRQQPQNRAMFMRILKQPQGITHVFRVMNQTSVLGRYLWKFRDIVGKMQHDLYHIYTVDQHILMVLRNIRRFFLPEHAHEYPLCSQIASGWQSPWILYLAALFHDIGKGRGGDHSQLGAEDVREFCQDHAVNQTDSELVQFLVREHLTMSQVAQKSDTSDPEVVQAFAQRMGDVRYLQGLYLLTVADIRGTSPKVWSAWKASLIQGLYQQSLRVLGHDGKTQTVDTLALVEERKREALRLLALSAPPHDSHTALWQTLGVSYFMRHEAQDIAWHTRHLSRHLALGQQLDKKKPLVAARPSPESEGMQVLVYAPDQTDLFARICGFFDQSNLNILDAKIHTTQDGWALDTFQIVSPDDLIQYRDHIPLIEQALTQNITQQTPLPAPRTGRQSRRVKSFPIQPRVNLRPDEKGQRWLLDLSASDRIGLLYSISLVLAKYHINLHLAKISTMGERVEDSLLVQGAALQDEKTQIQFEMDLIKALSAAS